MPREHETSKQPPQGPGVADSVPPLGNPRIVLSQRDWETVLKTVDEPPREPSARMQKIVRQYQDDIASGKLVVKES
ncbi:MAG: type II toxin-antitoxin system TacA family antitoxin [Rhodospirillales bacterium]